MERYFFESSDDNILSFFALIMLIVPVDLSLMQVNAFSETARQLQLITRQEASTIKLLANPKSNLSHIWRPQFPCIMASHR